MPLIVSLLQGRALVLSRVSYEDAAMPLPQGSLYPQEGAPQQALTPRDLSDWSFYLKLHFPLFIFRLFKNSLFFSCCCARCSELGVWQGGWRRRLEVLAAGGG